MKSREGAEEIRKRKIPQTRKLKNELEKTKRLLRNRRIELRREQYRHQIPVPRQRNEIGGRYGFF